MRKLKIYNFCLLSLITMSLACISRNENVSHEQDLALLAHSQRDGSSRARYTICEATAATLAGAGAEIIMLGVATGGAGIVAGALWGGYAIG